MHKWPGYHIKKFQALFAYASARQRHSFFFSIMKLQMDPVEGNLQECGKHLTVRRIIKFENNISTLKWSKHIEVIEHRSLKINPRRRGFNVSPPLPSGFPRPLNPPPARFSEMPSVGGCGFFLE